MPSVSETYDLWKYSDEGNTLCRSFIKSKEAAKRYLKFLNRNGKKYFIFVDTMINV